MADPVVVSAEGGPRQVAVGEDVMEITPLGSGCEVGRSCIIVTFKGATVMFDCGAHPAYTGLDALPFFDEIDPSSVDLCLVTHFHMDHCGAVPYLTEKTNFRGRVFMTHPTKAVYKILLHDAVKIGHGEMERVWDERDMLASMEKIELIAYHQVLTHRAIRFWCYNAGHVLGACMFMIEIAGVRVLYTGDFSRQVLFLSPPQPPCRPLSPRPRPPASGGSPPAWRHPLSLRRRQSCNPLRG